MKVTVSIFFLVLVLSFGKSVQAQIYAGGSYVYAQISESALDDVTGFSFDLQGDFKLRRDKMSLMPTIRLAVMDSKIYNIANPFYIKNLSFSSLLTYELVSIKGFSVSPYGGPFVSLLQGRRAPSLFYPAAFIDDTRVGAELGIELELEVYDYCTLKINPINVLIGNDFYRQGNINVLINF
jgi:hypothetical protein